MRFSLRRYHLHPWRHTPQSGGSQRKGASQAQSAVLESIDKRSGALDCYPLSPSVGRRLLTFTSSSPLGQFPLNTVQLPNPSQRACVSLRAWMWTCPGKVIKPWMVRITADRARAETQTKGIWLAISLQSRRPSPSQWAGDSRRRCRAGQSGSSWPGWSPWPELCQS